MQLPTEDVFQQLPGTVSTIYRRNRTLIVGWQEARNLTKLEGAHPYLPGMREWMGHGADRRDKWGIPGQMDQKFPKITPSF